MVLPALPVLLAYAGIGGLTLSGLSNVARQVTYGNAYQQFGRGYKALDQGYRNYLARQGRQINPNRALTSYYGQYIRNKAQMEGAYYGAIGSAGGSIGAGSMLTSRWF